MRKSVFFLALVAALIGCADGAAAFDGQREGFLIGFGAGLGMTDLNYRFSTDDSHESPCTDFRIGTGLSARAQVYFTSKVAWWDQSGSVATFGVHGPGGTYFLEARSPSQYFTGTVGFAHQLPLGGTGDSNAGFGFALGTGLEFARGGSLDFNFVMGNLNHRWVRGVRFTIGLMAY